MGWGEEVCIRRPGHIGIMRKMGCGTSSMKRRNRRGSMLCLVFFGSQSSRRREGQSYLRAFSEHFEEEITLFRLSFDFKYLVAEFESTIG